MDEIFCSCGSGRWSLQGLDEGDVIYVVRVVCRACGEAYILSRLARFGREVHHATNKV